MGSSAKTGKFFIRGSQERKRCTFLGPKHKSTIWDRTPSHLYIKPSLYVCRRVQGSQIFKQNWIILIRSRVIVILSIWVFSALGVGQVGGGCLGWSAIVYMSSGMFRGKESSNRIELSRLVQDLLNFGVLGSLRLWGWGVDGWGGGGWGVDGWGGGGWGVPPTHVHMHVHACTHTHAHAHVLNMIISWKWLPPLGESLGIPYDVIRACACVCMCACACMCMCMGGTLSPPPPPSIHPPTPRGGPLESVKIQ